MFSSLLGMPSNSKDEAVTSCSMTHMGYSDPEKVELLSSMEWIKFSDLRRWVVANRPLQFSVVSNRSSIRLEYRNIPRVSNILGARFPQTLHVLIDGTVIGREIAKLLASMDVPDRSMNKEHQFIDVSDAKRAYDMAWVSLGAILGVTDLDALASYGVFGRRTFEKAYSLRWT